MERTYPPNKPRRATCRRNFNGWSTRNGVWLNIFLLSVVWLLAFIGYLAMAESANAALEPIQANYIILDDIVWPSGTSPINMSEFELPRQMSDRGESDVFVVKQALQLNSWQFAQCFKSAALRNPYFKGTVDITFRITERSEILPLQIKSKNITSPAITSCLLSRLAGIRLPDLGYSPVDVYFAFVFDPPSANQ